MGYAERYSEEDASGLACRYLLVVEMLAWPKLRLIRSSGAPLSIACVACPCRSQCAEELFSIPTRSAARATMGVRCVRCMRRPDSVVNTGAFGLHGLGCRPINAWKMTCDSLMDRVFEPFPSTVIWHPSGVRG